MNLRHPFIWYLLKALLGFAVGILILFVLNVGAHVAKDFYYSTNDGNHFLNVQSLETDGPVNTEGIAALEFCREPRTNILAYQNFRTFYILAEDGESSVLQRMLPDDILYEPTQSGCDTIRLFPTLRPNDPGTYRFCQQFAFDIKNDGKIYTKDTSFCSGEYVITD